METKAIRAEACTRQMLQLRQAGFNPDLVVAHPGWGEALGVKLVWPRARLGLYCEYYYRSTMSDVDFDPEFASQDPLLPMRLQYKNLNTDMQFISADAALAPTRWQASTFPPALQERITVVHDGIDTSSLVPQPDASFKLPDGRVLTRSDEVVTFVSRNLEPYRGFHIFMRALPELLQRRPGVHVVMVGGDGVSYGAPSPDGRSWRAVYTDEVRPQLSPEQWGRVCFAGHLPYTQFVSLLQVSRVHCYLTYPFVLSWSLLESMSLGCAIVASNTAPVREVIEGDSNGVLVDFFDQRSVVEAMLALLDDKALAQRLGRAARESCKARFDLETICLPAQLRWIGMLRAL